jgi:signal transduction histidine kinase
MSQLLHPSALDDFGLPATLTAYLRNFSHRTGIRAQLAETIDIRLAAAIELCVYRIVQEALNNIAQHSGATACTVSLSGGRDMLRLLIEDNGCGPAGGRFGSGRGLGVIGMRERAQSLGGTFAIKEREGGGTSLVVTLPLETGSVNDSADTKSIRRAG